MTVALVPAASVLVFATMACAAPGDEPPAAASAAPVARSAPQNPARDGGAALSKGDTTQAIGLYSTALEDASLPNDRRAMILNDRAVAYARRGQTRLAFEDFNKAVQLFPEYAAVYNNRGNLLLAVGQVKEAIKDFDRALVLAPGYAAAYNNRAGALMRGGELQAAIRDYTQAVRLLPAAAAPLGGRGRAHLELGRPHAAIRDFSRAVMADGSFAGGYRSRAEAKIAVGHFEEAIEDLSRAIAFDLGNVDMYVLRGRAYLATANMEAAIKDLARAVELRPDDAAVLAERGLAHGRNGDIEEALADLARAIELDPRSARAFAYRAFVYKEANQVDVGSKDVAIAVKLAPDAPEVLWAKAEMDEAMGLKEEALAGFRRALFLDPSLKLASDAVERLDGDTGTADEKAVPGLELGKWQVVMRGNRYFAVNPQFRRLSVPLELMGPGQPRIIGYEEREPPLRGIAVLTFSGGQVEGASGPEEMELAAVLNLATNTVVAIEPHRQGAKVATWTWAEDRVSVAAVDGVTDELVLRGGGGREPMYSARGPQRRYTSAGDEQMQSFDQQQWGGGPGYAPQPRREYRPPAQHQRRKPKTLFDLLFN
jgi:tetratricopeptide (TPR) repeat protein